MRSDIAANCSVASYHYPGKVEVERYPLLTRSSLSGGA